MTALKTDGTSYDVLALDVETGLLRRPHGLGAARGGWTPTLLLVRDAGGPRDVHLLDRVPDDLAALAGAPACATEPRGVTEPATVVVASIGRYSLEQTLTSLLAQDHPDLEVLVVDNSPATGRARVIAERLGVRCVDETVTGSSAARNTGVQATDREVLLFVDDDVVLESDWARQISATLGEPGVGCVTGLVLPAELAAEQVLFEVFGGFNRGLARIDVGLVEPDRPLHPWTVGRLGAGCSMGFRRAAFVEAGGFAPILGAGTTVRGGEDLAAFHEVLRSGWRLVYEPRAIGWHRHRNTPEALRKQLFGYGSGLSGYLVHTLRHRGRTTEALRLAPGAVRHLLSPSSEKNAEAHDYPLRLRAVEWAGMAAGPFLYARASLEARRAGRARPAA